MMDLSQIFILAFQLLNIKTDWNFYLKNNKYLDVMIIGCVKYLVLRKDRF